MAAQAALELTIHGPTETLGLKDQMLATYLAAHADQQHDPWATPERFWERLVDIYAPTKDFATAAAWRDGEMVGYAFGSVREQSKGIWSEVQQALPDLGGSAGGPIYIFREFAVAPPSQGQGVGHAIHDHLLATRPEALAHLLVRTDNEKARRAYVSWGWRKIGEVRPFEDSPLMEAMVVQLPMSSR